MQTLVKTLLIGVLFAVGTGSASAADAVIGTWQLNVAKSTFSPGPGPKSQTRTYAEAAHGIALTIKTTSPDGKESTATLTFTDDGKPSPMSGNPDFDTVSVTRVSPLKVHSSETKAGVKIGTGIRSVTKDGKTLTFAQKGMHADGTKYDNVLVYDRQ
ncbi:MAG TPA: hypothetical protein VHV81_17200 [Steroidobacteraceae bacterium]|jgi:hypothetical protein|nr:hypothetical protein [Steroidobacteraceae bacterium]